VLGAYYNMAFFEQSRLSKGFPLRRNLARFLGCGGACLRYVIRM
jgi:hypothetical protein